MDNPRLTFDIEEPSPAAHQDNEWRQRLRYEMQGTPYEISTIHYKASIGELALRSSHNTMVNEAIWLDTRKPKTEAARSLRSLGREHLRRADQIIRKRKSTSDYTRLTWGGNTV